MAKQLNTPIISGNVSLYNETDGQAIYPTPMIGMVGLLDNIDHATTIGFKQAGDAIYVIGATQDSFNGSEIQKMQTGTIDGQLFGFDDAAEMAAQTLVRQAIGQRLLASAHDLAEGGLIVGLLESSFAGALSFNVQTGLGTQYLFAETPSRFVVSVAAENMAAFEAMAGGLATRIGDVTTGDDVVVTTTTEEIVLSREAAQKVYQESISWQLQA